MRALAVLALLLPVAAHAGEVTVIRPTAFIGADSTYFIVLDGRPLRDIETRQHVRFDVPSGRHTLAVRCPKSLSLQYAETRVEEELGPAPAFFVIEPKFDCVTISRIDARAAAPHALHEAAVRRQRGSGVVDRGRRVACVHVGHGARRGVAAGCCARLHRALRIAPGALTRGRTASVIDRPPS